MDPSGCGVVGCGVYGASRALGASEEQAHYNATAVDAAIGILSMLAPHGGGGVVEPVPDVPPGERPGGAGGHWPTIGEVVDPNVVRQKTVSECGVACAEMVTKSKTFKPSREMFLKDLGKDYVHGAGVKPTPLAESLNRVDPEAGKSYVWRAEFRGSASPQLVSSLRAKGPWVASMRTINSKGGFGGHVVVVDGLSSTGNVLIRDPAGKGTSYEMTMADFDANWDGFAVYRR
jgi:hypothetical protein